MPIEFVFLFLQMWFLSFMKLFGKPMFNNLYRVYDVVELFSQTESRFVIFDHEVFQKYSRSMKLVFQRSFRLFLSSPIACVACERMELLKTEICVVVVVISQFCSFVIASFCLVLSVTP